MDSKKLHICSNSKEGAVYYLDRDTGKIYMLPIDLKGIAKTGESFGLLIALVIMPIIGLVLQPLRSALYIEHSHEWINVALVVGTIVLHIFLGLFYKQILGSKIFKNIIDKSKKLFKKTKSSNNTFKEAPSNGLVFEPVELDSRKRRKLLRKSIHETIYLSAFIIVVWIFIAQGLLNDFIAYSNLLTYIWFSSVSLVLISPLVIFLKGKIILSLVARKKNI